MVVDPWGWSGRVAEHSATVAMNNLAEKKEQVACPCLVRESGELERTVRNDNHFVGAEQDPHSF